MTDRFATCRGSSDGRPHLADIAGDDVWAGSDTRHILNTGGRNAVEVFATDRDRYDEIRKCRAVLGESTFQSSYFIIDAGLSARAPETQKKRSFCIDGRLDGLGGGIGCSRLDQGIDSSAGEATGTDEVLGGSEIILVLLLGHGRVVCVCATIVETLH